MRFGYLAIGIGVLGGFARAESPLPRKSKTVLSSSASNSDYSPVLAEIELRPSWNSTDGHFFAFNYGELGVRFSADVSISYQQEFINELSQYGDTQRDPFRAYDGYLRTKVNKIWKDPKSDTTFSYESRIYTPTDSTKRDAGMVLQAWNYFKLTRQVSSSVSVKLMEVPILHVYTVDGSDNLSDGQIKSKANPIFENQVYLELDINPPKTGWSISFPIMLSSTRYREYLPQADNSGAWAQWVEIYPEIDYKIAKHAVLGVAYESGNILNAQTSVTNTSTSPAASPEVGSGTLQLVLRSTF